MELYLLLLLIANRHAFTADGQKHMADEAVSAASMLSCMAVAGLVGRKKKLSRFFYIGNFSLDHLEYNVRVMHLSIIQLAAVLEYTCQRYTCERV